MPSDSFVADLFSQQLILALCAGTSRTVAARLSAEAWVRLGGAESATVLSINRPDVICVDQCSLNPDGSLSRRQAQQAAPISLLVSSTVSRLLPQTPGVDRTVLRWPELAVAILIDTSPDNRAGDSPDVRPQGHLTEGIPEVCRQLFQQSHDAATSFPNDDQLQSLAEFAAGAGHEINNPLGSILGQTQLLLKSESRIEHRQALETIGAQAWRIRDMIGDTMLFARPPAVDLQQVDMVAIAQQVCESATDVFGDHSVNVELKHSAPDVCLHADPTQMKNLINHLVRNACEAICTTNRSGTVTIEVISDPPHDATRLIVRDTGPGITDLTTRRHLFDPFYSGRQAGRGLGFGLSLCWQIVRQHGGILLPEMTDQTTAFHIALPNSSLAEH